MEDIVRGIGTNLSVLLSLTLVFFLFSEHLRDQGNKVSDLWRSLICGLALAAIGILVMAMPLNFGNGVIFDARTILIGLAAAFFSWLPALIAALACAAFRIYQGGAGMLPGILTILISFLIGLGWRRWRGHALEKTSFREFYALGVVIHLGMAVILLILLPEIRATLLKQIVPVMIVFYPLVFAGLGLLMLHWKRLENERLDLAKSRERYRNLFRNNHLPMFLIDPSDGSFVDVNPAAESFYGWSREEFLGMQVCELNTLSKPEVLQALDQAKHATIKEFEFQHRLRDGSIRDILVRTGPVEIEGRELLYSMVADQSESKRLMTALRESEARAREYVSAVEQCRVSIVFTDRAGQIEYVNPYFCQLTGYSADEVIGKNPNILSAGRQSKGFYEDLWQTLASGQVWAGEFCNRRKDGSLFWENAVIAPIKNAKGAIEKYVGVKHDITAQKEQQQILEEALRQARAGDEAKAAFLSIISHELRTPLNHIVAPCELVLEDLAPGESRDLLETAIQAAHGMTELVQRIIRFSELSGETESELHAIESPQFWLEFAVQAWAQEASTKGFKLECTVSEDFPESFAADEAALSEILEEFLKNALEYSRPGTIRIELSRAQEKARLAVIDPGPAISEIEKEKLFKPFQQLNMSSTRSHQGIGLGLCLCQRYAQRCGGSIELHQDSAAGNRFEFLFPTRQSYEGMAALPYSSIFNQNLTRELG